MTKISIEKRNFGWKPDVPDFRDYSFSNIKKSSKATQLPSKVDLRKKMPAVVDQGNIGSCTANAIAIQLQYLHVKQNLENFLPSRLFIYYNERKAEGTVDSDAGAMIRDGIKSVSKIGAPDEKLWPYVESKFTTKPSDTAYSDALGHKALSYYRIDNRIPSNLKDCLAQGLPFVFGFSVYESFETIGKSGKMKMPKTTEKQLGGHAVLAIGYTSKYVIVRNSWGKDWGNDGNFLMPWDYITSTDLCDDFWCIKVVS